MQETARRIAKVSVEAKLSQMVVDDYVESFKPNMMDVVHAWCQGSSFATICSMTDIFEGLCRLSLSLHL
jgi:ATP-dependent RNA helicase DOB1